MFGANRNMFHFWTKAPANHGKCVNARWADWWGIRIHGDRLQFQNGQIMNEDDRFNKQCLGKFGTWSVSDYITKKWRANQFQDNLN